MVFLLQSGRCYEAEIFTILFPLRCGIAWYYFLPKSKYSDTGQKPGGVLTEIELILCGLFTPKSVTELKFCSCSVTPSLSLYSTLEERARRLFATKGVPLEKLDPSLFAKSKLPQAGESSKQRELAFLEAQVYRYTEMLGVCEGMMV